MRLTTISIFLLACTACSNPQPGPDKSIAGAVLGAGWGAGAGAVVGNQINNTGPGAGVGAGFGAVNGLLTGAGYDLGESAMLREKEELASLRVQNTVNAKQLEQLQSRLDRAIAADINGGIYQVFFDTDGTSLKSGAVANLEIIADAIKASPSAYVVNVVGHSDDGGDPTYNERLAEARARTVAAYLGARGVSMDRVVVKNFGGTRPIATNSTPEGRQLNRRVDIFISR
jgi:outer membrane protein OmpA-like peptidoglycan-associated protein